MTALRAADRALSADWLGVCRRASDGVRKMLEEYPRTIDRAVSAGLGEGGDMALVIDRAAEQVIVDELERLGLPLTAVCEERGHVEICGGGPVHVVIDPIDGSRNAKRGLPLFSVSIAVASGTTMGDVQFAYVREFGFGEEWTGRAGEGAWLNGARLQTLDDDGDLEILGLESIRPPLVAQAANALEATGAARLRAVGSIALSLCWVAAGRLDGLVTLAPCRSVDSAAGQLIVREAGGHVAFPEAGEDPLATSLELAKRSRVLAASSSALLVRLTAMG